jgi:carbonic anhydrase
VVRNAGQVIAETILGSLEFAVEVLKVPLILILGHDNCGAIQATVSAKQGTLKTEGEFIQNIVTRITPTIDRALAAGENSIDAFTDRHIRDTIAEITDRSKLIASAVASGKVGLVGAQYNLALGEVHLVEALGDIA